MKRTPIDHDEVRHKLGDSCFICELVAGNPEHAHHVVYEDTDTVAFLSTYPTLVGYVIVAPKQHKEQVIGDFTEVEYTDLQRAIHRVGTALTRAIPTERLYILSLGSQQANSHVHWHLAPLPPGVPFKEQQYRALDRTDYLAVPAKGMADLSRRLRDELDRN